MSDIVDQLVKRYGPVALIAAAVLGAVVWALAHFSAAPGTDVAVLWGLAKYTKPNVTTITPTPRAVISTPGDGSRSALSELDLELSHGLSKASVTEALVKLRANRQLRELRTLESNQRASEIAPSTYFWVFGRCIESHYSPLLLRCEASRYCVSPSRYFEVHRSKESEFFLLGFISEPDSHRVRHLSGTQDQAITVFPGLWEAYSVLAVLPVSRIQASSTREVQLSEEEDRTVLDLVIR